MVIRFVLKMRFGLYYNLSLYLQKPFYCTSVYFAVKAPLASEYKSCCQQLYKSKGSLYHKRSLVSVQLPLQIVQSSNPWQTLTHTHIRKHTHTEVLKGPCVSHVSEILPPVLVPTHSWRCLWVSTSAICTEGCRGAALRELHTCARKLQISRFIMFQVFVSR